MKLQFSSVPIKFVLSKIGLHLEIYDKINLPNGC